MDTLRYYAELVDKVENDVIATPDSEFMFSINEPYGVVGAISPWNAPLLLAAAKFPPALAAGNAVVLKPSELTPFSVLKVAELGVRAGLPAGLFSVLVGLGGETGAALVRHPDVNYVTFTGSTQTGAHVMAEAALHGPKPVSLELGGKSPQLVFDDIADLDTTAEMVASSIIHNAGQICFAGTRLVVQRGIAEPLLERITTRLRHARPGPTWRTDTTLPPIVSSQQLDRIDDILSRARKEDAEITCGGRRADVERGFFYQPTIVRRAAEHNPAVIEEIFGPVLTVASFDEFEEGVALADHPVYGLAAGVHTSDVNKALRAARMVQAGSVWINTYGLRSVSEPIGGYKQSGFGKDFGNAALHKYLRSKTVELALQ